MPGFVSGSARCSDLAIPLMGAALVFMLIFGCFGILLAELGCVQLFEVDGCARDCVLSAKISRRSA